MLLFWARSIRRLYTLYIATVFHWEGKSKFIGSIQWKMIENNSKLNWCHFIGDWFSQMINKYFVVNRSGLESMCVRACVHDIENEKWLMLRRMTLCLTISTRPKLLFMAFVSLNYRNSFCASTHLLWKQSQFRLIQNQLRWQSTIFHSNVKKRKERATEHKEIRWMDEIKFINQ